MNKANNNRSMTNLINANVMLQDENKYLKKDNEISRNIIARAIEYVEKWQSFPHTNGSTHEELRNLKEILEGER